jgi:hypothetical protein
MTSKKSTATSANGAKAGGAHPVVAPLLNLNGSGINAVLRQHAEQQFAEELAELARQDRDQRPANWRISPKAVATYLLGGKLANGYTITPKYIGQRRIIEIAIATLATDRALLLMGVPGTAKTWVSEHLAAAICGNSTLLIQGTAGTSEEAIRYGCQIAGRGAKFGRACAQPAGPRHE